MARSEPRIAETLLPVCWERRGKDGRENKEHNIIIPHMRVVCGKKILALWSTGDISHITRSPLIPRDGAVLKNSFFFFNLKARQSLSTKKRGFTIYRNRDRWYTIIDKIFLTKQRSPWKTLDSPKRKWIRELSSSRVIHRLGVSHLVFRSLDLQFSGCYFLLQKITALYWFYGIKIRIFLISEQKKSKCIIFDNLRIYYEHVPSKFQAQTPKTQMRNAHFVFYVDLNQKAIWKLVIG